MPKGFDIKVRIYLLKEKASSQDTGKKRGLGLWNLEQGLFLALASEPRLLRSIPQEVASHLFVIQFAYSRGAGFLYLNLLFSPEFVMKNAIGNVSDFIQGFDENLNIDEENGTLYSLLAGEFLKHTSEGQISFIENFIGMKTFAYNVLNVFDRYINHQKEIGAGLINKDIEMIMELEQKISANLSRGVPSVEDMAESTHMSLTKFKHLFKQVYDESPHRYFLRLKLEKALLLLEDKERTISEVAYTIGFRNPSSLTKLFIREFGLSPQDFRSKSIA